LLDADLDTRVLLRRHVEIVAAESGLAGLGLDRVRMNHREREVR
jgi:hypothetical protein